MCRLFSVRSRSKYSLAALLEEGPQTFTKLSVKHNDGWGIAYYDSGRAKADRSVTQARFCPLFKKTMQRAYQGSLLAHLRKATKGSCSLENNHPFVYRNWSFAHNGNFKSFVKNRSALIQLVHEDLRIHIGGTTDSELLFYLFLSKLKELEDARSSLARVQKYSLATQWLVQIVYDYAGPLWPAEEGGPKENYLTFMFSDGDNLFAFQGGKDLYYQIDRDPSHKMQRLMLSSVPMGASKWESLEFGSILYLDREYRLIIKKIIDCSIFGAELSA